ncbi:hypothetical protein IQ266_00575 [filamentous cyanobacterium LEGE 11480]|uniref:Aminoglycoside nucleotidyltransferase n=1 Tax=Romeriopsis navalis LEGE 11480 TaxID=2777977 RepID=A0A928Z2L3_9CYAN|nr:hypothetical protein [Romeriopsis navalis]MBE9028248.1 hypothetical protein [Romeriopsis navalis LEGE 11480]
MAMQSESLASSDKVEQFLSATRAITMWIDGGWGVDALLRHQRREHTDIDIIIAAEDVAPLTTLLESLNYQHVIRSGLVYLSPEGLLVDIHWVRFDARGYGHFDLSDGGSWPMPPSAFRGSGSIGATLVQCLSPEAQVQCHAQGYKPREKDLSDMKALQEKFEVVLPLALCR